MYEIIRIRMAISRAFVAEDSAENRINIGFVTGLGLYRG